MRRKHPSLEEATMNLTPLIDVVFVILIMFIVVAPLLEMDRVELAPGPPLQGDRVVAIQENSPITLHIFADNTVTLNQQKINLAQLSTYLSMARTKNPQAKPQLFHDRKAMFGTYQIVKNAVEEAGFPEMDVILKPE